MIRIPAIACVVVVLAGPALAADPPIIINMPSANKAAPATPQNQAKPADQLPKVVNYPSGSDGTMQAPAPKPAGDAAKPAAVLVLPGVYSLMDVGAGINPYAGLSADYSMSMYGGPSFMTAGFPMASNAGAAFFGSQPPWSAYFYTFAPAAMIYRDLTTTPLGKTAYFAPDGSVFENPSGFMAPAVPAMVVR
jgi:hypothetical protein